MGRDYLPIHGGMDQLLNACIICILFVPDRAVLPACRSWQVQLGDGIGKVRLGKHVRQFGLEIEISGRTHGLSENLSGLLTTPCFSPLASSAAPPAPAEADEPQEERARAFFLFFFFELSLALLESSLSFRLFKVREAWSTPVDLCGLPRGSL